MKLGRRHIVGIGFVAVGAALQFAAIFNVDYSDLRGTAAGAFVIGIAVELIGYAFDSVNKNQS